MSLSVDTIYGLYVPSRLMDDYSVDERAINGLDAFKIGYRQGQDMLVKGDQVVQLYEQFYIGQNYPSLSVVSKLPPDLNLQFVGVNGIPFKMMYGYENKSHGSYVEDTTHVIQNMPSTQGRIPEYTWFKEKLGGEVTEYYGCAALDLGIAMNVEKKYLNWDLGFKPHSMDYTSSVPNTRKYPQDNTDSEISSTFILLDTFTWDSDNIGKPISINFSATRSINTLSLNADGTKQYLDVGKHVSSILQFTTADPPADMWTEAKAGTPKDIVWKVTKADTDRYFSITLTNFVIEIMEEQQQLREPEVWEVAGRCENITAIISDNIDNEHYDEPTES